MRTGCQRRRLNRIYRRRWQMPAIFRPDKKHMSCSAISSRKTNSLLVACRSGMLRANHGAILAWCTVQKAPESAWLRCSVARAMEQLLITACGSNELTEQLAVVVGRECRINRADAWVIRSNDDLVPLA